jgi:hypothetical protein
LAGDTVFVSPHPDDIALSCGGLVAELRSRGEEVVIVTVFGGAGTSPSLTDCQRDALGFGGATGAGAAPSAAAAMAGRRSESLFGSDKAMVDAVRSRGIRVGQLGGIGPAERYWRAIGP